VSDGSDLLVVRLALARLSNETREVRPRVSPTRQLRSGQRPGRIAATHTTKAVSHLKDGRAIAVVGQLLLALRKGVAEQDHHAADDDAVGPVSSLRAVDLSRRVLIAL